MTDEIYDLAFYQMNMNVVLSAELVFPWMAEKIRLSHAARVIDVSCGIGAWSREADDWGCRVYAVDHGVPENCLVIDPAIYHDRDFNAEGPMNCAGFDLAICLEVGEHLPEEGADGLVAGLCEARFVLWSAAVPGQGGSGHINEQWASWWEPKFNSHGKVASCDIRDVFWDDVRIHNYYRQNLMIYGSPEDLTTAGLNITGARDERHPECAGYEGERYRTDGD